MNVQKLPAGICDQGVEIFRDNEGRVFFLQNGNKLPYLMLDSESREYFQADLAADKTALAVLKKEFGLVEAEEQEEMFVGCRYGNLDYRADLIEGKLMPDAPRCGLISTCPGFNVICRIPLAPRGALTRSEYRIVILISLGKQAKEISEILGITDSTTRTHIQRIHNKLGVNNNIEGASWAHEHRIV